MMMSARTHGHVLVAEDEPALAALLAQHLGALGHRVTTVAGGRSALEALRMQSFDVALVDIVMPPPDGLEVLRALREDPDPPAVVIMTGQGTIDTAVQAMRLGAFAYLAKPYRMAELDVVIARALEHRALAHENAALRTQVARTEVQRDFVTEYAPLRAVYDAALTAAATDKPVLIVGEPGTGKCALARTMHARSLRAARPFVQLEASMLAGAHVERALFGSGRSDGHLRPRAVLATRGTLYLHDVTAIPARAQARLVRALADRRFRADDAGSERAVLARLIAATPCPLSHSVPRVQRELAEVLNATCIVLPPLRERAVDILPLASAFLAHASDAAALRLDPDAQAALQDYSWPGNVAELRAVVERARLLARNGVIQVTDLALSGDSALELADVERRHIRSVLEAMAWHQGRAAESLGIAPKTLYRKMREYGLHKPQRRRRA